MANGQLVMPYFLRPMVTGEISQVAAIEREAFPTLWPGTNYQRELRNHQSEYLVCVHRGERVPVLHPQRRSFLDRLRRRSPHRLVDPPELIVGYMGLWFMGGEGHIVSIAVGEQYRGQGIGELLMLAAVEMTLRREQQVVTLEVRVSNEVAQSLYRKYGLSQVGLRKAYYSDNREDAYIMSTQSISSLEYGEFLAARHAAFAERYGDAERTYHS